MKTRKGSGPPGGRWWWSRNKGFAFGRKRLRDSEVADMDKPRVTSSNSWGLHLIRNRRKVRPAVGDVRGGGPWCPEVSGRLLGSPEGPTVNICRSICGHLSTGHWGKRPLRTRAGGLSGVSGGAHSDSLSVDSCTLQTLLTAWP